MDEKKKRIIWLVFYTILTLGIWWNTISLIPTAILDFRYFAVILLGTIATSASGMAATHLFDEVQNQKGDPNE